MRCRLTPAVALAIGIGLAALPMPTSSVSAQPSGPDLGGVDPTTCTQWSYAPYGWPGPAGGLGWVCTGETRAAPPGMAGMSGMSMAALTQEFLDDPENVAAGKVLWDEQCAFCHGKRAYPGKAPKLKPKKYTPEFVYQRVVRGFRGMPAWEGIYSDEELRGVVAYVLSKKFSP